MAKVRDIDRAPRPLQMSLVQDKLAGKPQHYVNNLSVLVYYNMRSIMVSFVTPQHMEQLPVCGEFCLYHERTLKHNTFIQHVGGIQLVTMQHTYVLEASIA